VTLDRRTFLRRSALALGGLMVGDAALEAFERLTHRPVFALGGLPEANDILYSQEVADDLRAMNDPTVHSQWPLGMLDVVTSRSVHGLPRPIWRRYGR